MLDLRSLILCLTIALQFSCKSSDSSSVKSDDEGVNITRIAHSNESSPDSIRMHMAEFVWYDESRYNINGAIGMSAPWMYSDRITSDEIEHYGDFAYGCYGKHVQDCHLTFKYQKNDGSIGTESHTSKGGEFVFYDNQSLSKIAACVKIKYKEVINMWPDKSHFRRYCSRGPKGGPYEIFRVKHSCEKNCNL